MRELAGNSRNPMNKIDPAHRFSKEAVRNFKEAAADEASPPRLNVVARQVASQYRRDTTSPVMVSGFLRLIEFALLFLSGMAVFK